MSLLVLKFFALSRKVGIGEGLRKKATRMKFEGVFDHSEIFNPSREAARKFLFWTGVINTLGLAIMYFFFIPWVDKGAKENQQESHEMKSEPHAVQLKK